MATATVCALFGLPCTIYMGATDVARQAAQRVPHEACWGPTDKRGHHPALATLKDAMNEAMRDWVANVADTYYLIGTVAGPHPYPAMVRDFQSHDRDGGAGPDPWRPRAGCPTRMVAAIGGGSNAMGLFHPFLDDDVRPARWGGGGGTRPG